MIFAIFLNWLLVHSENIADNVIGSGVSSKHGGIGMEITEYEDQIQAYETAKTF